MPQTIRVVTASAPSSSQSVAGISIDTTELRNLAKMLRQVDPAAARSLTRGLGTIGDLVVNRAKEKARGFPRAGEGTDRIEGSIRKQRSGATLRIVAGGDDAPEAAPLEHNGQGGAFRHPVFGNQDVWVDQTAHPFLAPAADEVAPEIEEQLLGVIDSSLREAGFDT